MKKLTKVRRGSKSAAESKRSYLAQSDVPILSLEDALRLPAALFDNYAGKSASPMQLAKALNMAPGGSQLRILSGAAIAFGLVEGGAQATSISPTELARRILRPRSEGEDSAAKQEAVLKPRVYGEFLRNYDGNAIPREDIAQNVLEGMGVPRNRTASIFERIVASAQSVGFVSEIKGKQYINLSAEAKAARAKVSGHEEDLAVLPVDLPFEGHSSGASNAPKDAGKTKSDDPRRSRVFITHGKNVALVDPIRKLLEYGELIPIISVEKQSVSKPVPEKVMDDMRSCGAAIIHIDADHTLEDGQGNSHTILNPNVLIEIGAAMAFYGRRFILLVRDGIKLPSNLQGLYEVRYSGETLNSDATIKLLEAIKDIKNYALPSTHDD